MSTTISARTTRQQSVSLCSQSYAAPSPAHSKVLRLASQTHKGRQAVPSLPPNPRAHRPTTLVCLSSTKCGLDADASGIHRRRGRLRAEDHPLRRRQCHSAATVGHRRPRALRQYDKSATQCFHLCAARYVRQPDQLSWSVARTP
eukprot:COSAG02_NODE_173_length_31245_cov_413.548096_13_plen_145_part_00